MAKIINVKLEQLFLTHYKEWCLFSYSYLGDIMEAEDIVQDVCTSILLRSREVEILNLKAYIIVAIKNKSLRRMAQLKKTQILTGESFKMTSTIEENLISKEEMLLLSKSIKSLPKPCGEIFKHCVIDGQKYKNVADDMGISVNTVKYHIKNGYKILRSEIGKTSILILIIIKSIFF